MLCIDIDDDVNTPTLAKLRLMYEYSFIKRVIKKTKHGYHIYIDISIPNDKEELFYYYLRYGDDERRAVKDLIRWGKMRVNVCFNSSELYEVKDIE